MDYTALYDRLIYNARHSYPFGVTHRHHEIPRSMGGSDDWSNLVRLSVKAHYIAHLILFRMGYRNQIFAVELLVRDNPELRLKRWVRKWIAREQARLLRERNRRRMLGIEEDEQDKYVGELRQHIQRSNRESPPP